MSLSVVGTVGKGTHSISVDLNVQAGEVVGIVGNNGVESPHWLKRLRASSLYFRVHFQ